MKLHGERVETPVAQPLDRAVPQVAVGHLKVRPRKRIAVHGVLMVLAGEDATPRGTFEHGLVCPAMAEGEFFCLRPAGAREKLIAEAYSKQRPAAGKHRGDLARLEI